MNYLLISYKNDSNIGIFGCANNKIAFFPKDFEKIEEVEKILKVKVENIKIWNSNLIGLFVCMNNNGILLPKIVLKDEIEEIKSKSNFLNIGILKTKHTALSNLIVCNDKAALISPLMEKSNLRIIKDVLNVEIEQRKIDDFNLVGSIIKVTNKGLLAYRDISEESFEFLKDFFKVKNASIGTVNFGSIFISSAIIANDNGILIGEKTSAYEIERILEALGFV